MPRQTMLLMIAVAMAVAGCGARGPERFQLTGKVTFAGRPVPSGLIRFEGDATKGNGGPVGYATIKDGRYTTAEQGSKGALKGPLVAVMTGGPAPNPEVEFPVMWFTEYTTSLTLEPQWLGTTFDIDVPAQEKR